MSMEQPQGYGQEPTPEINTLERQCEVSEAARRSLESWGVTEGQIDELARLSAKYEYGNCSGKLDQIAQRGGIITTHEEREAVILTDYFDLEDRIDGQCTEIAAKVLRAINRDWLDKVNEENADNEGYQRLHGYWLGGTARTHFTQGDTPHYWAGVGPKDASLKDIITVDGSFLEISSLHDNGYSATVAYPNLSDLRRRKDTIVRVGDVYRDEEGVVRLMRGRNNRIVVGLTDDREHDVCLGFAIDRTTEDGEIRPYLSATGADGESEAFLVRIGDDVGFIDESNTLSDTQKEELYNLLLTAERIQLMGDPDVKWGDIYETTSLRGA